MVVDVTSGVSPVLDARVRENIKDVVTGTCGLPGGSGQFYGYHISENEDVGERKRVDLCPSVDNGTVGWLLTTDIGVKERSAVFLSIKTLLTELMRKERSRSDTAIRVDIYTDGLENTDKVNSYRHPEVFERENWKMLDKNFGIDDVELEGIEVHIHPLPLADGIQKDTSKKAIAYLADRLNAEVEPL
jgi:hypothetical protein